LSVLRLRLPEMIFDDAIVRYMRKKHNLLIGERTAEDIKIRIGSAYPRPESVTVDVRGRNLVTGLPKTITVTSEETEEALKDTTSQIVEAVHSVLEKSTAGIGSRYRRPRKSYSLVAEVCCMD